MRKWLSTVRSCFARRRPPAATGPEYTAQFREYAGDQIGHSTYGRPTVLRWPGQQSRLTIGKYTSIADKVTILLGGEHRTDWLTTYPFAEFSRPDEGIPLIGCTKGDVTIGHDVWIGYGATILSGVTIGHGAIIGAAAVVARDIAPYSVAAGNPVKVLRTRFDAEVIERLLAIAWWDWEPARVKQYLPLLLSGDADAFFRSCAADMKS